LGRADDILVSHGQRDRLYLDRGGAGVARLLDTRVEARIQIKSVECQSMTSLDIQVSSRSENLGELLKDCNSETTDELVEQLTIACFLPLVKRVGWAFMKVR
jgi:hypothetical protein